MLCFVVIFTSTLSGCGDMRSTIRNEELLSSGKTAPPDYYHPGNAYCYRTLSSVECYDKPVKGAQDRLVGSYEYNAKEAARKIYGQPGILDSNDPKYKPKSRSGLLTDFLTDAKKRLQEKKAQKRRETEQKLAKTRQKSAQKRK